MVGDHVVGDNASIQYRREKDWAQQEFHDAFLVSKVEPVTLPGFFPVKLNDDSSIPRAEQDLVFVGYGKASVTSDDVVFDSYYPGMAMETTIRKTETGCEDSGDNVFCAADFGRSGPCVGTRTTWIFCRFECMSHYVYGANTYSAQVTKGRPF